MDWLRGERNSATVHATGFTATRIAPNINPQGTLCGCSRQAVMTHTRNKSLGLRVNGFRNSGTKFFSTRSTNVDVAAEAARLLSIVNLESR